MRALLELHGVAAGLLRRAISCLDKVETAVVVDADFGDDEAVARIAETERRNVKQRSHRDRSSRKTRIHRRVRL